MCFIYCRLLSNHIESKLQDGPWWDWRWYHSGYVDKIREAGKTQIPIAFFTMSLEKQNKVWKGIHFSPVCSRQWTGPVRIQQSFWVPFTGWIGRCEMQKLFFAWRYIIYLCKIHKNNNLIVIFVVRIWSFVIFVVLLPSFIVPWWTGSCTCCFGCLYYRQLQYTRGVVDGFVLGYLV